MMLRQRDGMPGDHSWSQLWSAVHPPVHPAGPHRLRRRPVRPARREPHHPRSGTPRQQPERMPALLTEWHARRDNLARDR